MYSYVDTGAGKTNGNVQVLENNAEQAKKTSGLVAARVLDRLATLHVTGVALRSGHSLCRVWTNSNV